MRPPSRPDAKARATAVASLDLLCFAARDGRLMLLLRLPAGRAGRAEVPSEPLASLRNLGLTARRFADSLLGSSPPWIAQVATLGDDAAHPAGSRLTIAYAAVVVPATEAPAGHLWASVTNLPPLAPRQSAAAAAGLAALRERMDLDPIAFRMLPSEFTLSELQAMYELLLGRPLHKASFRRALAAAGIVSGTDAWRSEGRGRPAQLYRYSPPRRRPLRRPVRFDLLG